MRDEIDTLNQLTPGMAVIFAGDRVTHVSKDLPTRFAPATG
jgi:hypothetical protein